MKPSKPEVCTTCWLPQAHIWDDGKQRYLGGFDSETQAGKAHDIMSIKTKGLPDGDMFFASSGNKYINFRECLDTYRAMKLLLDSVDKV